MNLTITHESGKTYIFGTYWPLGRSVAADAAQARKRERELANLIHAKSESEAA